MSEEPASAKGHGHSMRFEAFLQCFRELLEVDEAAYASQSARWMSVFSLLNKMEFKNVLVFSVKSPVK